jgi:hypothetical protein
MPRVKAQLPSVVAVRACRKTTAEAVGLQFKERTQTPTSAPVTPLAEFRRAFS